MLETLLRHNGKRLALMAILAFLFLTVPWVMASSENVEPHEGGSKAKSSTEVTWSIPIGAALALGFACLATGYAQAKIGPAGVAAIAEDRQNLGGVIMMVAIPETVAILGFVIAYLIVTL